MAVTIFHRDGGPHIRGVREKITVALADSSTISIVVYKAGEITVVTMQGVLAGQESRKVLSGLTARAVVLAILG